MFSTIRIGLAVTALMAFAASASAQNLILNGGFELNGGAGTPIFTNWTATDIVGSSGSFLVQTGTGSPLNAFPVPLPPEAAFAAMTDQGGPGTHVLIQPFIAPAGGVASATLTFSWFVNNQAGGFIVDPIGLDHTGPANQHARVDILTGTATPFSTAGADVLLNAFITNPGDPPLSGYNVVSIDVTALLNAQAGNTLQIRLGEVDNQLFFGFGVDDVSLVVSAVPEPTTWALFGLAGAGITGTMIWRRRKLRNQLEASVRKR